MFRIDHPSAAVDLPPPDAAGTPGYFTEGDPAGSTPATTVTADWANAVQEEISHVIEGAGIALDKTNNGQLLLAINALISGVGTGALLKANNLSDLTNVPTARTNLGLGTMALKSAVATSDVTGLQAYVQGLINTSLAPYLTAATAASTYLQKNNPTFTGTMTGPAYNKAP